MRFSEIISEGGWDTVATQGTVINPTVVRKSLKIADRFLADLNTHLKIKNIPPIKMGVPTGSSAYHEIDPVDKIYGDIDLQIIVPEIPETRGKTMSQRQTFWNGIVDEFIRLKNPRYVHPESTPGHPIFNIGNDQWVQVDLMPHTPDIASWGSARTIPERGIKGMLHGNMFSVLGDMLNMSIQHGGVQFKQVDGVKQPFSKTRKNYELVTITKNPETFVRDIFDHEAKALGVNDPKIDPLLTKHPGKDLSQVKISNLVNAVKGLAQSFEINGMYGKGDLVSYSDAADFIDKFWKIYQEKALKDVIASKREKAETPAAKARAEDDKKKILQGLAMVKDLFGK